MRLTGEIIIGRFDFSVDENEGIVAKPSVVDMIPEITVYAKQGNTSYCVTGFYGGNTELSTKVSRILKREMEEA